MKFRLTGLSLPWLGAQWERVPGDKELAQSVITFLENRRVLFAELSAVSHVDYCIESVDGIRRFLTEKIDSAHNEDLRASLRAIRAAGRKFADAAGTDGRNFRGTLPGVVFKDREERQLSFAIALGDLRTLFGIQIARIAAQYDILIEEDLASILPPPDQDDLSWIPGFD